MRDIGQRVAELRRQQGWTQEVLAERLDVSVPYVQRIERGGQNLTVDTMVGIAAVLACPFLALLEPPRGGPRGMRPGRKRRALR